MSQHLRAAATPSALPVPSRNGRQRPVFASVLGLFVAALVPACAEEAPTSDEGRAPEVVYAPIWVNGSFEDGTHQQAPPSWNIASYSNPGLASLNPQQFSDLGLSSGGALRTWLWKAAEGSQADSYLGSGGSIRWPKYGGGVAVLDVLTGAVANTMDQTMTLTVDDIDPVDGKVHIRFALAPILQNPNHAAAQQPYFYVELRNLTKGVLLYKDFNYANQPGVPWKSDGAVSSYLYTDWQLVDIAPTSVQAQIGDQVKLLVVASGCSPSGHWARVYIDGVGPTVPSLFVSAVGPASANAGDVITYDMNYMNGGTGAAGNSTIKFTLPANTTFSSVQGAVCTTPAVGATGVVTCNLGTINPGQSGTFKISVKIDSGATGTITAGNYTIESLTLAPLLGPKVFTTITSNAIYADLSITKTDNVGGVAWGSSLQYVIVATNLGPSGVTGASVVDVMPAQLSGVTWTCVGAGGGTCTAASGNGNINTTVNLPLNATATFTVNANVINGTGTSSVTNSANISVPAGTTDSYPNNNGAADSDFIGELRTVTVTKLGIGQGNLVSVPSAISCGTSCTTSQGNFVQGQQIVLSVNPLPGHTFEGWGGDCAFAGTSNCSITVTGNLNITATISKPTVGNGTDCSINAECTSGICVDGVCCNTSCGGGAADCQACNLAGKRGTCSLLNLQGVVDGNVCDGADNDCDGSTDEDYAPLTTNCGVGFCARTGQTTCSGGQVGNTCVAGQPSAGGEVCDGVDNDCDGLLDAADNTLVIVPCDKNTGVCAGLMKTASMCVNGAWQACPDSYYASNRFPNYSLADSCDAKDNDCDGSTDEDFVTAATACGTGQCARTGQRTCSAGTVVDTCSPGQSAGSDTSCDGVDNNCNGQTDEGYVAPVTNCGTGACARSGFAFCVQGSVINSCSAGQAADSDTSCDGVDNNCNGQTDEGFVTAQTSCGVGVCARNGQTTCSAGVLGNTCAAGQPEPGGEICDGKDNDCDGLVDGADPSMAVVSCEKQAGVCSGTTKPASLCVSGAWQACTDATYTAQRFPNYATVDTCDNKDNDCDGVTDENFVAAATSCGVGVCVRAGQTTCTAGVLGDNCVAGQPEVGGEVCDNKDNDCDGLTDGADPTMAVVNCEKQSGVCSGTTKPASLCVSGAWQACTDATYTAQRFPNYATVDSCDNKDNDCDGVTDENFVATPTSCGVGVCVRSGQTTCAVGVVGDNCVAGQPEAGGEICDSKDNDCDGLTDGTDPSLVQVACEKQSGVCAGTLKPATLCVTGAWQACTDAVYSAQRFPNYATSDACDNKDNDCDGITDENFVAANTTCGQGVCERTGRTTCSGGNLGDTCQPGNPNPTGEICDGVDNDCDGLTDALDPTMTTIACEKQAGVCAGTQKPLTLCVNGGWQPCTDATYSALRFPDYQTSDGCDGKDNNCNGATDESFQATPTTCGQGYCTRTGQRQCVSGAPVDSCVAGAPRGSDDNCDGVDDNCNGSTDEGWVAVSTSCGTGACARNGQRFCVQGQQVDSCNPGSPAVSDTTCNGVDDNCNGLTDDGFAATPTTCGKGVCARTGQTSCNNGFPGDTCVAGPPSQFGEVCDGLDNDCDGLTDANDPDLVLVDCEKQAGVCAGVKKSASLCVGGAWQACSDAFYTLAKFPDYNTSDLCDGKDNNCNGVKDENFAPTPTSCGQGVCVRSGQTTCVNGVAGDSCTAGQPEAGGEVCDGKDNDCDGLVDAGDPSLVRVACEKQAGVCAGSLKAANLCVLGTWQTCTDAFYTAALFPDYNVSDACDGKDNDCDGVKDEDHVATATSCGVGACVNSGQRQCVSGAVVDSCAPKAPAASDLNCNGVDDNCNGSTDEGWIPPTTHCGTGACARTGLAFCVQGRQVDSCAAAAPASNDRSCNGVDDNCNGQTDEEYPNNQICVVGLGACERTGAFLCASGALVCGATAGVPTVEKCDAIDNDCNGTTDDGAAGASVCEKLETNLTSKPPTVTASREATFTFIDPANPTNTNFECSLDGGDWVRCDGGAVSYAALGDGPHTFLVRAIGADGSVDSTPAFYAWRVDQTMPDTIISIAPSDPSQTTSANFAFTTTVAEVGSWWCALDAAGSPPAASAYVRCDQSVRYDDLSEGPHTLWVYVVSAAGVADPTPASHTWVIDLSAPETEIASGPQAQTNSTNAAFTFLSPGEPDITKFRCRFEGGSWTDCSGGTMGFSGLPDGDYTFEVAAIDQVGIVDPTPALWRWTVDTTAPDTFIPVHPTNPSQNASATFAFSSNELDVTYWCAVDAASAPASGAAGWTACSQIMTLEGLAGGSHTIWVAAVDAVGNWDPTPAAWDWIIDTAAPDTAITQRPPVQIGPSDTATFKYTSPNMADGVAYECRVDQGQWAACDANGMAIASGSVALGEHTFQVRACTVASGLCDPTPAVASWTVTTSNCPLDAVAPALTCAAGGTFECTGDGHATVVLDPPSATDPCGVMDVSDDVPTVFELGTTPVVFAVQDGNKNRAACVTEVKVVDTTPPTLRCGEAITVPTDVGACGATLVPEAPVASDVCRGDVIVYNNAPAIFPVGTNKLTWTALDAAGLTASCDVEVTVEDREPAVLDCAGQRVVEAPADACSWSGVVEASARDNCAVEVTTLSQDRRFPVGVNDVLFTSTDPTGNVSTCTTKLEVRDVTAPTVACPAPANDVIGTFKGTAQDACEVEVRVDGVVCEALDAQGQVTGTVDAGACPVAVVDGALVVSGRLLDPALRVRFQVVGEDVSGNTGTADCSLVFSADADQDGVLGENDNCPTVANEGQLDTDSDGIGDACDVCPTVANPDQADADGDRIGDVCEDADADGVYDLVDNCLTVDNSEQTDTDSDGVGDRCDVCPAVGDNQADSDSNGVGDACQDSDADGVIDIADNCPALANGDQLDSDNDGKGDLCDDAPYEDFAASGAGACSGGDAGSAWPVFLALAFVGLVALRRRSGAHKA